MIIRRLKLRKEIKDIVTKFKNGEIKINTACDLLEELGAYNHSDGKKESVNLREYLNCPVDLNG